LSQGNSCCKPTAKRTTTDLPQPSLFCRLAISLPISQYRRISSLFTDLRVVYLKHFLVNFFRSTTSNRINGGLSGKKGDSFSGQADNRAAGMQAEVLLDFHVTDLKKSIKMPFSQRWRKREQNEKVTYWNNAFCVAYCRSYSNDGTGRYWRSYLSATTHRIRGTSGGDSDP